MSAGEKQMGNSNSAHTPGPWSFYTEPQPNGCPIVGTRGLMVAMLAHSVHQADQQDEALANARLIAAAPELLEACRYAMRVASLFELEMKPVLRAIAAATGSAKP